MNQPYSFILIVTLSSLLSVPAFSQAPVIDDSDNFSLVEEQNYDAEETSVAKSRLDQDQELDQDQIQEPEDMKPLVEDNSPYHAHTDATAPSSDQIQMLQQEIQELRGQLEVQSHDLKMMQQQQLAFYKDLDNRLQTLKGGNTETNLSKASPGSSFNLDTVNKPNDKANPADEQIRYLAAYDLVQSKQYNLAIQAMRSFISQYPKGGYTANAHYWLGELYLVQKDNHMAMQEFETVLSQFPTSTKVAASDLKIAYALAASGKIAEARSRLKEIMQKYPDTPTANMASQKLETLKT